MEIEYKNISEIKPYDKNPRKNNKSVEFVANSIKEFGFKVPIIIDKDNVIVCGHTRYKAAVELKLEKVPCINAKDLSDQQIKAFRLADNKTGESSEWDFDLLNGEIDDIFDLDMTLFGFAEEKEETPIEEDNYQVSIMQEPKAKRGDIYILGNHRLMCGDSTSIDDVKILMNNHTADMVFTDPPYGYNYQSNMREKSQKFNVIENDDKKLDFFPAVKEYCRGFVYVCTTWKVVKDWIELFEQYFEMTNMIIWNKGRGGMGDLYHTFSTDYEIILVANQDKEIKGKRYGSVWDFTEDEIKKMKKEELIALILKEKEYRSIWNEKPDDPNDYVHPTQKPVLLAARAIRSSTETNENVLDLFCGSGSTIIACEQINRNCYAMEYDPAYVDVIIERWEQFTGKKAEKIDQIRG